MTDGTTDEKELRSALQLAVCKIIFDEDRKAGTRSSQGAIAALTELTYQYATKSLVPDLYMFSTHANRKSTISPDDVALVLRKIDPDQLETFQQQFCRAGGTGKASVASKATTSNLNNRGEKRISAGRRRKRDEADVLSLSSSSSSSEDDDASVHKETAERKRQRGTSNVARPMKTSVTTTTGRKTTKTESLLNKFQLRAESRASSSNKRPLDYDLLSSSDDDILQTKPAKSTKTSTTGTASTTAGKTTTTSKFSLQSIPFSKKEQSNVSVRNKKESFLDDDDDDSTDDDDDFILRASKSTNKTGTIVGNQDEYDDSDDDDNDDFGAGNNRNSSNSGNATARGIPKQSQVEEALANLSSDSGMDEDESEEENEVRLDAGKSSSSHRHRPRIDSDDDDD